MPDTDTAAPARSAAPSSRSGGWEPLRHPDYRRLWLAQFTSNIGSWMQTVAAQWLITSLSGSALLLSATSAAGSLPVLLLAIPAGVLGDLLDRKRVIFFAQVTMLLGAAGLAVASDIGIALQTLALAVLLHRRRMVSLAGLDYRELGRCLAAGAVSGAVVWSAIFGVSRLLPGHSRWMDAIELALGAVLWLVVAGWLLDRLGSALPRTALKRLGLI